MFNKLTNRRGFLTKGVLPIAVAVTQCKPKNEEKVNPNITFGESFEGRNVNINSLLLVSWTSSNVSMIDIKLVNVLTNQSKTLALGVNANNRSIELLIDVEPGEYRLILKDSSSDFNISTGNFSIIDPEIYVRFTNPILNGQYRANQEINIEVLKKQVNNYNLLFSDDNGVSFITLLENQSEDSITVRIPITDKRNCLFRLVSSSNNAVFSDSSRFEIVALTFEGTVPNLFIANDEVELSWNALYETTFIVQFSTNGTTFSNVVETDSKNYVWNVSQQSSNNGRIRIVDKNRPDVFVTSGTVLFRRSETVNVSSLTNSGNFSNINSTVLSQPITIRRVDNDFEAISRTCTHNGCTVD
ncbi:MAG: hypothetical protein SNJ77_07635 [Cytophagales bacterium]